MRIAVAVKQVPETKSVKMDPETRTVVRQGVQAIINPLDLYAIEAALRLKESCDAQITALSMGPPQAVNALKEAVAMGIDQAVLISDRAFSGSDTWATSYILAAAIRKLGGFELILCGERATDGDTGQVGPEMAAALGLPVITYVNHIHELRAGTLKISRLVEGGMEKLALRLPGVITVVKEIGEPRLPTFRGKLKAKKLDIPVLNLEILQLDKQLIGLDGSPTRVVKIFRPEIVRRCHLFRAETETQTKAAVEAMLALMNREEVKSA
ncbi:MAG: electron transfer flavoprotein subunit beta/FixA family protein [Victivallaceae bacterium]|nr:electron transfer flavoprotein subunit beta/FixA family protein [Victivallaceae bacterium]